MNVDSDISHGETQLWRPPPPPVSSLPGGPSQRTRPPLPFRRRSLSLRSFRRFHCVAEALRYELTRRSHATLSRSKSVKFLPSHEKSLHHLRFLGRILLTTTEDSRLNMKRRFEMRNGKQQRELFTENNNNKTSRSCCRLFNIHRKNIMLSDK